MEEKLTTRLIARYLAENCTGAEEDYIKEWVQSDSENRELMEKFKRIWKASEEKNKEFDEFFDPAEGWEDLRNRMTQDLKKEHPSDSSILHLNSNHSKVIKRRFAHLMRVAAIILFASLIGVLAYQNLYQEQKKIAEPVLREIAMERGQRGNITLSDGTKVILNAESKIILPKVFKADKREVTLKGQAFFDVTHNPDRPFIINTDDAVVQVLGTSLDVRSYPGDNAVQVVVKEGRVSLASKKECADDNAILSAGEMGQLSLKDNRITKKKVEDFDLFLSWTEGYLKFKNTPMHEVAGQLERKYDIEIRFEDEDLKKLRLTAELKSRTIQHNMDVISTSLNMKYKMDQEVVTFFRNLN